MNINGDGRGGNASTVPQVQTLTIDTVLRCTTLTCVAWYDLTQNALYGSDVGELR